MGLFDVLMFLEEERKKNPDKWFKICEVKECMGERGYSISQQKQVFDKLYKLAVRGVIKCRGEGFMKHYKLFQAKR
jgi:hypothetical protein